MQRKYQMTPEERDLMVRTVVGEADDQGDAGQAAVAHVIMNRLRSGRHGSDIPGVVLAPKQFEPWQTRARYLMGIDPQSKTYQRAAAVVDQVANGDYADPTGGATHFLDEGVVKRRRGGRLPGWADGSGIRIGDHTFYAPEGRVGALPYAPTTGVAGGPISEVLAGSPDATVRTAQAGSISADDIAETLRAAGLSGTPSAAMPAAVPAAPHTPEDLAETARAAGIQMERGARPVPKPEPLPEAPPARLGPGLQAEAERTLQELNPVTTAVTEAPVVGPLITSAAAALRAGNTRSPAAPGDTFGERFAGNEAILREAQRLYGERNPRTALGAGLVGSTALTGLQALHPLGRVAMGLEGPSLASRVYTGGLGEGVKGLLDAALRGDNPVTGLEVGAAGGIGGPLAGQVFRGGAHALSNLVGPRSGSLGPLNTTARGKLVSAMEGETPASIAAARARMGPAGMAGDLNTAMTDIAGGMADIPGPHKAVVRGAYGARSSAQPDRIDRALTSSIGPHADIEAFKNRTIETRKAAADPLYEQWRSMEVRPTPELQKLIPRLEKAGAFNMAEELAGISGHKMDKAFFTTGPQKNFPTTETWDYVKRGLDRRIDQAYTAGDKTLAASLIGLKHDMIDEIEKTPAGLVWKQARQEFASRSALLDQIERGRDTFLGGRSGTSVDELRHELKGIQGPELAARLQGLRSAADQVMGDTLRGDTTLRNKMLAKNNQDKMRLLLGPQKADDLIRTMRQEKFLGDQAQNVVGGSQTTPKRERIDALVPPPTRPMNFNVTQPATWVPHSMLPHSIADAWRGQRHATALNQLAPLITTPEGPALDRLLDAISKEGRRRSRVENFGGALSNIVSAGVAGPGASTARRQYFPTQ